MKPHQDLQKKTCVTLLPPWVQTIRQWFEELLQNGLGFVLNAISLVCVHLTPSQPFTKKLAKEQVISSALPVYRKLAADDQDSVRLLTVQDLIVIAQQLQPDEVKDQLLLQLRQSVSDKSWRVRYMVANYFVEVRMYLPAVGRYQLNICNS